MAWLRAVSLSDLVQPALRHHTRQGRHLILCRLPIEQIRLWARVPRHAVGVDLDELKARRDGSRARTTVVHRVLQVHEGMRRLTCIIGIHEHGALPKQ